MTIAASLGCVVPHHWCPNMLQGRVGQEADALDFAVQPRGAYLRVCTGMPGRHESTRH